MILFLLGSGVSPSPKVRALSDAVLGAHLELQSDGRFSPGVTRAFGRPPYGEVIPKFLSRLQEAVAIWQGRTKPSITYEDLGAVCLSLDKEFGTGRNAAIAPYWKTLAREFGPLVRQDSDDSDDEAFAGLVEESVYWIKRVVELELGKPPKEDEGRHITAFLNQVILPTGGWSIVTLNHDMWFETVLTSLNQTFHDGFENEGNVREFHPSRIRHAADHLLLKLHGSIDWRWHSGRKNYVKIAGGHDDLDVIRAHHEPELLIGTFNKLEDYNYAIYPYLFTAFDRILSQATAIVICGYGFGDSGVNLRILSELQYRPEIKLVIVHPSPRTMISSAPFHARSKLVPMICSGRICLIKSRFEDVLGPQFLAALHRAIR